MDSALLERLENGAEELAALVEPLDDQALDASSGDGKWSIRQIVHHLADESDVWPLCIKEAIATPGERQSLPALPSNEAWSASLACGIRPVGSALELLRAERRYLADLLRHFELEWDQTVVLVEGDNGKEHPLRVADMVAMLADHVDKHVETIRGILGK